MAVATRKHIQKAVRGREAEKVRGRGKLTGARGS